MCVSGVAVLLAALLRAAHLQSVAGWCAALPPLPLWRNPPGDVAQAIAGAEAFLHDPAWHLPLTATDRLVADGTREPWQLGIKVRALSVRAVLTPSGAAAR